MFEITVKLDSDAIEAAVKHAWQKEFLVPDRFVTGNGGDGLAEVKRQVREYIAGMDLTELIARAAKARIDDVVNEVVTAALREKAKQRAKEMARDGTLIG